MTNNSETINTVLVTAVGAPPGLNALRALQESGRYHLVASDADRMSPSLYTAGVRGHVLPKANHPDYIPALMRLIKAEKIDLVIPCIEEEVQVLANNQQRLEAEGANILLPSAQQIQSVTDKGMITQRAFDLGIPCPGTLRIKPTALQMSTLGEFQKQYPLPWIVKPVQGHGMRGVFLVESIAEAVKQLQSADSDCLIQECIPGAIGSMHLVGLLFNRDGKVIRRFSSHSIRTLYANGGPATAGISKNLPELIRTTERIFESLGGWRGPANVEWMLDPRDGRFKFIEVNPRLWGYGFLAVGAGVNFPVALVEAALGRDPGADPGFKDGITMVRTTHDLIFDACPFDVKQG